MGRFQAKSAYGTYENKEEIKIDNDGFLPKIMNDIISFIIFNEKYYPRNIQAQEEAVAYYEKSLPIKEFQSDLKTNKTYFLSKYNGELLKFPENSEIGDMIVINFGAIQNNTIRTNIKNFGVSEGKGASIVGIYGANGYNFKSGNVTYSWNLTITEF